MPQYGIDIFLPDIIVVIDVANKSYPYILPTGVANTLPKPDAVTVNITILPDRSGNSSYNGYTFVLYLKSIHILPLASVLVIPYLGIRSASTPAAPVFI